MPAAPGPPWSAVEYAHLADDRPAASFIAEACSFVSKGDEPGDRPPAIGLTTEDIDTLFSRHVLCPIGLRLQGPPHYGEVAYHDDFVEHQDCRIAVADRV